MIAKVYRNLHKNCLSIIDKKTRRVAMHRESVVLKNAFFTVSQSGRKRVLKEKRKNVHAFVHGEVIETDFKFPDRSPQEAYYNPYKVSSFVDRASGLPVTEAAMVLLSGNMIYYWK